MTAHNELQYLDTLISPSHGDTEDQRLQVLDAIMWRLGKLGRVVDDDWVEKAVATFKTSDAKEAARKLVTKHTTEPTGKFHIDDGLSMESENYVYLKTGDDEERTMNLIAIIGSIFGPIRPLWAYLYADAFETENGRLGAFLIIRRAWAIETPIPQGWDWDKDYVPYLKTGVKKDGSTMILSQ